MKMLPVHVWSVALAAVRVPSVMRAGPSTIRRAPPVMIGDERIDMHATRDQDPMCDPNTHRASKSESFAEYMARRSQLDGVVVATNALPAHRQSEVAARMPAPAPSPAPSPAPVSAATEIAARQAELEARRAAALATPSIAVQGGSLRTWAYSSLALEEVQVVLSSEGRPIDAVIELWQGPGNIPYTMRVFAEDGIERPFTAVIATPRTAPSARPRFGDNVDAKPSAAPSTVAIRNTGQLEFPFTARCLVAAVDRPSDECVSSPSDAIQGGALRSYPFDPSVDSVQVLLQTDGRPLYARVEILQGPNNNKQVVELYSESGRSRPFFAILETPGAGNVVRVVNTATMEYPLSATVVPHAIGSFRDSHYLDGPNIVGDLPRVGRYG